MENKETIKAFIAKKVGESVAFSYEDDIFQLGMVNSLFALELVVFLENTFGISVENEDLNLENFNSVDHMATFVERKKSAVA